ncbi:SDR family oxidoreductase [Verrucomicrobiota bacterium sgz303538]
MNLLKLDGRVALITGGGSGIGAAAARLLAQQGAKVGLLSRTPHEVEQLAREITESGGAALPLRADVARQEDLTAAIRQLTDEWGRLDIVFANAGVNGVWAPLEEITPEEWDQTIAINLRGTFLTVRESLPWLKQRGGSIIITASVNGTRMFSNTGATAYACSKAAQVAFAKMTAVEFAKYHVRVNVICPGFIESAIHDNTEKRNTEKIRLPVEYPEGTIPLTGKKPGRSEQVAELVLFLASDQATHITGTEVYIDGAQSLLQG